MITLTWATLLAVVGSIVIPTISILISVHMSSRREHKANNEKVLRLENGLSATRKQVDHLTEDHKSFKEDVSRALERVYDKIDSVHDLVVQIALKDKQESTK